jgi:hypothetical protein
MTEYVGVPAEGKAPRILVEFMTFLNDSSGAHYYATQGFHDSRQALLREIEADPDVANQNFTVMAGTPEDETQHPMLVWDIRELVDEKLGWNGAFSTQLSNMWVVNIVAAWEYYFRPAIANLLRRASADDLKCDEMGDLNLIRNDIVHHQGVAQADKSGRCRSLRWFSDGERIHIEARHIYDFQQKIGRQIADWVARAAEIEWEKLGLEPPWKPQSH